jgi:hypothetical protein
MDESGGAPANFVPPEPAPAEAVSTAGDLEEFQRLKAQKGLPAAKDDPSAESAKIEKRLDAAEGAVNESAKRVNGLWISFVLMCVYVFIATLTITPVTLFREAPVKLPIFNVELPLLSYFS